MGTELKHIGTCYLPQLVGEVSTHVVVPHLRALFIIYCPDGWHEISRGYKFFTKTIYGQIFFNTPVWGGWHPLFNKISYFHTPFFWKGKTWCLNDCLGLLERPIKLQVLGVGWAAFFSQNWKSHPPPPGSNLCMIPYTVWMVLKFQEAGNWVCDLEPPTPLTACWLIMDCQVKMVCTWHSWLDLVPFRASIRVPTLFFYGTTVKLQSVPKSCQRTSHKLAIMALYHITFPYLQCLHILFFIIFNTTWHFQKQQYSYYIWMLLYLYLISVSYISL